MRRFAFVLACCVCACAKPIAPTPSAPAPGVVPVTSDVDEVAAEPIDRCFVGPAGRLDLLPSTAEFVVGVDLATLFGSAVYRDNRQKLEQGRSKAFIEAVTSCGIGVERWRWATLAFDGDSELAAVLTVDGIGRPETVACIREADGRIGGQPWTRVEDTRERYTFEDGSSAWVLDTCTVVVANSKLATAIEPLLDGRGTSVLTSALEPVVRRAIAARPVWFAGLVPAGLATGSPFDGATDVAGNLDLSSGLALNTSLAFATPSTASTRALALRKQFVDAQQMFTMIGFPQSLLDRVQIDARGPTVTIDANATPEELAKIQEILAKF